MRVLRSAVIGLGRIGWQFHAPEVQRNDKYELIAVVDPVEERLTEGVEKFGVKGYSTIEELFENETLDLIIIASPTLFHKSQAIMAMQNGCDVLCDKPPAPALADVDEMIEAMHRYGRKLMVYQPLRFTDDFLALQSIIKSGIIGKPYMMKGAYSAYTRRNDWQAFIKNGGGMLNNYGAHLIDKLLLLSGSKAERIECELRTIATLGDADDVVKALITTENGIILDIDINMATAHEIRAWHIIGECGSIIPNDDKNGYQIRYFEKSELSDITVDGCMAAPERQYESGENIPWKTKEVLYSDFKPIDFYEGAYEYFGRDGAPIVPVEETREVMRVLQECRKSSNRLNK